MNEQAKAWDAWRKSKDAAPNFDAATLKAPADQAEFLGNRLWHAFNAGYEAARRALSEP